MPFGTINSQTVDYAPRADGRYTKSTLAFGDPDNSFIVRGASISDPLRTSVSRLLQKDVVVGGDTIRKSVTVTLSIVTPKSGFTSAEIDSLVLDLSNFINADTVTRLMMGES